MLLFQIQLLHLHSVKKNYIYSNVWIPSQTLAFNVTDWKYQESGSAQAVKWKIQRTKSRWSKYCRKWTKGDENVTNPLPKKPPWVKCGWKERCVRSVYYQPFSTALKHARTETLHFHFSLGWAVIPEYQAPPLPKCDPLRFTSSIKTFQWSVDGVLSPCKKAPPMGRCPSSPPKNENKKNKKTQDAAVMECTSSFKPLQHIFSSPSLWILFSFPNGLKCNQWHTPATLTLNVQHTLALRCHRTSHSHLITSRKLHAHTSRSAD